MLAGIRIGRMGIPARVVGILESRMLTGLAACPGINRRTLWNNRNLTSIEGFVFWGLARVFTFDKII